MSTERLKKLWDEIRFRREAIWKLYPKARVIFTSGGFFYDMEQPSAVLIIMHADTKTGDVNVVYEHELTLLSRAIDKENRKLLRLDEEPVKVPGDHPSLVMNQFVRTVLACACSEENWSKVKEAWRDVVSWGTDSRDPHKNPYLIPKPDGFYDVGAVDLLALANGSSTVDEHYIDKDAADKRVQFMAWEILQWRYGAGRKP